MRLSNKTALVTAAGQGIGRASAIAMAREGAQVLATDLNPALLESLKGIPNITTRVLDVMDKAAIQSAVASLPKLNVLFNCAGFVHHGAIDVAQDKDWDFAFDLNVRSQFWAIQAALPVMLANGGGSIINMASIVSVRGLPNRFIYGHTVSGRPHQRV
jgi:2-keto-3-deoxy-L-fuconate dehydrogenase